MVCRPFQSAQCASRHVVRAVAGARMVLPEGCGAGSQPLPELQYRRARRRRPVTATSSPRARAARVRAARKQSLQGIEVVVAAGSIHQVTALLS
jgi:hypothetical protein